MNTRIWSVLVGAALVTATPGRAEHVELRSLPQQVQTTIQSQMGGQQLKRIETKAVAGNTVYEVRFAGPGKNRRIFVDQQGLLVNDANLIRQAYPNYADRAPSMADLPVAVQNAIRVHAGNMQVDDIDRDVRRNRTVYQVEFAREGKNVELDIAEDGAILRDSRKEKTLRERIIGSRKLKFEDLPAAVQQTVRAYAGSAAIEDVDRRTRDGKNEYEVAFKLNGKHTELRLAENGLVLNPEVLQGQATVTTAAPKPLTPLANASKITFDQVPEAVKHVVQSQVSQSEIEDIDKGTLGGKTVYQFAFKRDGKHTELQVSEDGTVMGDSGRVISSAPPHVTSGAPAATGAPAQPETGTAIGGSKKMKLDEVPEHVRNAIKAHLGGAHVEDIDRQVKSGRVVYEVAFKQNGQHTEVLFGADGSIVSQDSLKGRR